MWPLRKKEINTAEASVRMIIAYMRRFLKAKSENEKLDNLDSVLGYLDHIFGLMASELEKKEPTVFTFSILQKSGRMMNRFLTLFNKFKDTDEYYRSVKPVIENIRVAFYQARKNLRENNDTQFYGSK